MQAPIDTRSPPDFVSLKDDPLLDEEEVRARLGGISQPTLYRHIRHGVVPRPLKIGKLNRWRASWIDAHIQRLEAAR